MRRACRMLARRDREFLFISFSPFKKQTTALQCIALHSMAVQMRVVNAQCLRRNSEDVLEFQANEEGLAIYVSHPFGPEGSIGGNCTIRG